MAENQGINEKRNSNLRDYKGKIREHKQKNFLIIVAVVVVLILIAAMFYVQFRNKIYTDYDLLSSVIREKSVNATDIRLDNSVFTYSRDGAHCMDVKGNITWNQTYEMQDIKMDISKDTIALGNYNGREIYVQSTSKILGNFTTTLPIKNLAVSQSGYVTAVLEDGDVTWLKTYDTEGNIIFEGQTHMHNSGYPCAISLSPNGELLAVSYLFVEAGELKTNIAFYNFGSVGENKSDHLVSTFAYPDLVVPRVYFMNNTTCFAVGDSRLMIYRGGQIPVSENEYLFKDEILSVYHSDKYIGLVFASDDPEKRYRMEVFNTNGIKVNTTYFDLDYRNIFFEEDSFTIYNETGCVVTTMKGVTKFEGNFDKNVNLMLPTDKAFKYTLITDNSIDTIQLK